MLSLLITLGAIIYVCAMVAAFWAAITSVCILVNLAIEARSASAVDIAITVAIGVVTSIIGVVMFHMARLFIASLNIAAL